MSKRYPIATTTLATAALLLPVPGKATELTIDTTKSYQRIDGFGTCLVSWVPAMARFYETPRAQSIFADEMRFNIIRANLWGDGTIGEMPPERISHKDPNFAAGDRRTPVFLNFAKAVKKRNPRLKVIGTVWSPPAWMKENGSITDKASGAISGQDYRTRNGGAMTNRVKKEYYPHFARWLVEMVKHYDANGVRLYAVSCANEPQFTQSFESCVWTAEDLATVTRLTADLLLKEGFGDVKVFGPETMTNRNEVGGSNRNYTRRLAADPVVMKQLGFFATHGYTNGVDADLSANSSAQLWDIIKGYGKPYWVTEGGTGSHDWPAAGGPGGVALGIHNAFVAGNASAFVPWQYAEAQRSTHNLMPTSGPSKKTYAVMHFSRWIPVNSLRVDAQPAYSEVMTSAYVTEDRKALTVVMINPTEKAQPLKLRVKGLPPGTTSLRAYRTSASEDLARLAPVAVRSGGAELSLPAQSMVTLTSVE